MNRSLFTRLALVPLILILLLILILIVTPRPPPPSPVVAAPVASARGVTPDPHLAAASNDLQRLRLALGNFLLAVKDPYRPPLGDNRDIARALAGGNRRGLMLVPTNDPVFRDGQLVDPWGTPYWFHPRTPDAIDVVSAGPDRKLFTGDDVGVGRAR